MTTNKPTCTFRLKDEVTAVMLGVDQRHLNALVEEFSEYVPGYKYMPLFTMGVWDGKTKFVAKTGKTYQALIPDIVKSLAKKGYRFTIDDQRPPIDINARLVDANQFIDHNWKHRPHQVAAINSIINSNHRGIILASTGSGKAQPLTARVLTPSGWKKMGNVVVGDIVIAGDGSEAAVTAVFPQGVKRINTITLEDGAKTRACDEHLWDVWIGSRSEPSTAVRQIVNTAALKDILNTNAVDAATIAVPLYTPTNTERRLQLLNNLVGNSYQVGQTGLISFLTNNKLVSELVQEMVWALGGTCTISPPSWPTSDQYSCSIMLNVWHTTQNAQSRQVVKIEYDGDEEAQCIMIDHPSHLYVTDDYIVTHNTGICAGLSKVYENIGFRTIVIVPNRDLIKQTYDQYIELGLDTGQYSGKIKDLEHQHVISTWQALKNHPEILLTFHAFICDEVQGAKGAVVSELLIKHGSHIPVRIGCTGTLPKDAADYKTIYAAIGEKEVYNISAKELQDQQLLATLHITQLVTQDSANPGSDRFPEYAQEKAAIGLIAERTKWIASFIEQLADADGNTLILVGTVAQGKKLQKLIGDRSIFLYGKDDDATRQEAYKSFANNNNLIVIANVQIAAVGLSINRIFNLVLVDIGKAFTRVIQSIGRGLRMSHDKTHVEVYDISSNYGFSSVHTKTRQKYYKEAHYPFSVEAIKYNR